MRKLLAYPLTVLYLIVFGMTLLIFHPIQWICFNGFGYQAHKKSVDILQLLLVRCLHILGTRFTWNNPYQIPKNKPLIIVSNNGLILFEFKSFIVSNSGFNAISSLNFSDNTLLFLFSSSNLNNTFIR